MMEEEGSNENPNPKITHPSLNDLPEELLLHILTFLPTLDSVGTSLISHKWRHLWSRVPSLDFNYQLFPPHDDTGQMYAEFVDRVLVSRSDSLVHTFRLSFLYDDDYFAHVDSWVRSAVTRLRARQLYLDFFIDLDFHDDDDDETENQRYDFLFSVLGNGCVEKLALTLCELTLPAAKLPSSIPMGFWSIGSLFLREVYLEDQKVKDLLLGCPNLEDLEICGCSGPHHLEICSHSLKRLILEFGYISENKQTMLVDCPNLCSISINSCAFEECALKNVSSLVEFHVDFSHRIDLSYGPWSKVVRLLEQAPNVKHLNVQNWWYKFLASIDTFPKSFVLYNLNRLELRTGFTQYDLVGMAALLKLCPNLETLVLDSLDKITEDESLPEELLDKAVELSTPRLKQVRMKVYTDTGGEENFVKMLMRIGARRLI